MTTVIIMTNVNQAVISTHEVLLNDLALNLTSLGISKLYVPYAYGNKRYYRIAARFLEYNLFTYIHTFHLCFMLEGVVEASQIFLRDANVLPKLLSYEKYWRRDRW
jgi:hypothetical protein